jgi:hypothetical protein
MKSSFKVLAAVSLLAGSAGASAAINMDGGGNPGTGTGGGELFISVLRNVPGQEMSALIDTGITSTQLLTGTVANGTVLGNVSSFFGTNTAGSFVFNAGAVANAEVVGQFGNIFTSNADAAVATMASLVDFSGVNTINNNMRLFVFGAQGNSATNFANNDDYLGLLAPASGMPNNGFHKVSDWGNSLGGITPFSTEGNLNTPLSLWAITINEDFTTYTRSLLGTLTADYTTGNITFNSPSNVPVPAAVWLLGSGLAGLLGVSRRRRLAVA